MESAQYSELLRTGALWIFSLSLVHMFLTPYFYKVCENYAHKKMVYPEQREKYGVLSELFKILSRVELVFILWSAPLFFWFLITEGTRLSIAYFSSRNYIFPFFVVVIVLFIESRPIVYLGERLLSKIANFGKKSPAAWWWTILLVSPFITPLIKETGTMVLACVLLVAKFFPFSPSKKFSYATAGLLFSNVSIGGMLFPITSRAVFLINSKLRWSAVFVLKYFSWKAFLAILVSTTIYYLIFRKEFQAFPSTIPSRKTSEAVPWWVVVVHILFLVAVIFVRHIPVILVGVVLTFLGFRALTIMYQSPISFTKVGMVGLFFSGLILFGDLQEWWVLALMEKVSYEGHMIISFIMSMFLDNALVNYLIFKLPSANDCYHYLAISGAMSAGGLTLMANVPNIIGYLLLRPSFKVRSVSLVWLFVAALPPAVISALIFWAFKNVPIFTLCEFK
ncbi:putative Na+/H+ antiporter [Chlamydiifrater phoenicopteri]|uniref:putative Na+/H+ antiporter n=1 Tax=Chlamydiifrater phoenicopteri TaxID=2681469 RepID=UPI001BD0AA3C|nr:putative Na+/H+ antiporter [Chlamydiifrater phoenicopteri]